MSPYYLYPEVQKSQLLIVAIVLKKTTCIISQFIRVVQCTLVKYDNLAVHARHLCECVRAGACE